MLDVELQEIQRKSEVSRLAARTEALESGFAAQLARIETLESISARVTALESQLALRIEALEKKASAPQTKK